jgi:MFS family permease
MRLGGYLADRWGSRWPLFIGSILQTGMVSVLAILPRQTFLGLVAAGVAGHGLGAGLTLAALDRSALLTIPQEQRGMAAGLFNMIRFGGTAFGAALMGVGLQYGLKRFSAGIQAYQLMFWCVAGLVSLSTVTGWKLKQ